MPFASAPHSRTEPATFRKRGLAVPFTSPRLAAARVRQTDAAELEIVLPNPSGTHGTYVVSWRDIRDLAAPTIHDTILVTTLRRMKTLDPRTVRDCALTVALEGYAGQDAAAAAKLALASDRTERVAAHSCLMRGLIERIDPDHPATAGVRGADLDRRAGFVLDRLAPIFRRPAAQLAASMMALGDAFGPIGVAPDDRQARLARTIEMLENVCEELRVWLEQAPDHDVGGLGPAITSAVLAACKSGRSALGAIRQAIADPLALLRRRLVDSVAVAALAERLAWLLDGWETVGLLWRSATTVSARRVALIEMAQRLPRLPREAHEWTEPAITLHEPGQECHVVRRDGFACAPAAVFQLTHRNEMLRAMGS